MSEWCQNRKCPQKKNQNQIRGSKGAKFYQSNKSASYYFYWCSMGCREQWWNEHKETCMNAVGFIDKQVLPLDDAWYVDYKYGSHEWDIERQERVEVTPAGYYLTNKLRGISRVITRQQAQTPEQISDGHVWRHIDDTQARELAITLGLAS